MPAANQNVPLRDREVVVERSSSAIGSRGGRAPGSSALMNGNVSKRDRSVGMTSARLMPRPPPMPVMKNAGGPPIGPLTAPKAKNDVNFCAVGDALAVAAEDRQPVDPEAGQQHADVLHGVAGEPNVLRRPPGEREAAEVGGDREAGEVDGPAARVEDRRVRGDDEGELQVVDRRGEAEDRDAAVEQERDALELVLSDGDAEADLLDVERAEAALDREPPRPVAVAGAQRDEHRAAAVLLHGERRAERRRQLARAAAGVRHDALARSRCRRCAPPTPTARSESCELDAAGAVAAVDARRRRAARPSRS